MAGSLNHIVDNNGAFKMTTIENMGDAHEALEECFDLIALLLEEIPDHRRRRVWKEICSKAMAPEPDEYPVFGTRSDK